MVASVPEVFPAGRRILVVGALGPRDPGALFDELAHLAPDLVLVCTAPSPRAVPADELLIEYVGEVIRLKLADLRELKYDRMGLGCYMFRVDDEWVVDATLKGGAARFINHSCDPNVRIA